MHACVLIGHGNKSKVGIYTTTLVPKNDYVLEMKIEISLLVVHGSLLHSSRTFLNTMVKKHNSFSKRYHFHK
jgi:hypothetical protein